MYACMHACIRSFLTGQTLPEKVMGFGTPLAMLEPPKLKESSPISPVL